MVLTSGIAKSLEWPFSSKLPAREYRLPWKRQPPFLMTDVFLYMLERHNQSFAVTQSNFPFTHSHTRVELRGLNSQPSLNLNLFTDKMIDQSRRRTEAQKESRFRISSSFISFIKTLF